jgi:hypothetical protein
MPYELKDIAGKKYGKLTAVKYVGQHSTGGPLWLFQCECLNTVVRKRASVEKSINGSSCGCTSNIALAGLSRTSFERGYVAHKYRAKRDGHAFELTFEEWFSIVDTPCEYCGAPPEVRRLPGGSGGSYVASGIDRIDSGVGYVYTNCASCCNWCNKMKLDRTVEEFDAQIERIYTHRKGRASKEGDSTRYNTPWSVL